MCIIHLPRCFRSCSHPSSLRSKPTPNNAFNNRKNRKFNFRPVVKKVMMNNEKQKKHDCYHKSGEDDNSSRSSEKEETKVFNPAGYEPHLVDSLEKDILLRNPNVQWNKVAGLNEAKSIIQEAMVLPIIMPDFFKV